ncbi:hypothetical protein TELCIR_09294 [Teladorsagia circumcincta]|uniref:Aldehyde oxidase/xanthine dehydrogenase second molybdopterin binding domain-containing protein n=1 Tax=Teladorsagia circumcincta TaxID=45464 RepID=A0A2G9UGN1_TELCI|nr:hypothetical protein TELCIR_09294 [Teladorsagia circumcincta]
MYEEGDCTPFGMHLRQCNVRRTWEECKETSNYEHRLEQVKEYNRSNKYRKRGIYMMPTRFGIGFGLKQLNQIAARVLDIPIEMVHIHDTATDKVPNASPTAASVGSDMNGLAVQAVGEPPLFLGACAFFAIREAVRSFRLEHGLKGYFRFDSPATPEQIRLACEDEILKKVPQLPAKGTYTPWTVAL